MNVAEFIAKWRKTDLSERAAAQEHFLDLCALFDHPTPAKADPTGETFAFEKGATKHGGGEGWADVWKKGFFGWEYKKKGRDLDAAYDQLCLYVEALENPPLLVVCDMERFVIRTRFTDCPTVTHEIALDELADPKKFAILSAVFHDPGRLKPEPETHRVTEEAARRIAEIAQAMRERGLDPREVARFLDRVVFCLFAEDVGLLPEGLFTRIAQKSQGDSERFTRFIAQLFEAMAHGGDFGLDEIRHFDGNLFADGPVLEMTGKEIESVHAAASLDWGDVNPSIFGTLFERGLDPSKRSQLGAHYTSRDDIETLVDPVIMQPLRREWREVLQTVDNLLTTGKKQPTGREKKTPSPAVQRKARKQATDMVRHFLEELAHVTVLDPACGSGNFLYVTLQKLKDLEKEVILVASDRNLGSYIPFVGPRQLYGIEINPYAHELAQMTVWIGYLQWTRANGFGWPQDPVLRPMDNFQCKDAILDLTDPDNPKEPDWPKTDFIVGNPPFLGDKFMRGELGDEFVDVLREQYSGRLPGQSDLCCYWFEKARAQIEKGLCRRAGLLATQAIRGGGNREALKRIKATGDIFFAESDRPWILDGANVHVSMIGFDDGEEENRVLDGNQAARINTNLTCLSDTTTARVLEENSSLSFLGSCKGGSFDVPEGEALTMLKSAGNPNGRPNSDVLRPVVNSSDLLRSTTPRWIIDNADLTLEEACGYQEPHAIVESRVKPSREKNRNKWLRDNWWRPQRMRPEMRTRTARLDRFVVTPTTAKHRVFVFLRSPTLPDHQLIVFPRSDDYFFGVLHSRVHEVWARAQGTQLRERESGFRYTPTTCFETFPFPWPPGEEPQDDPVVQAIAQAAKELDTLRTNWLNPPEWTKEEILEFPGSANGPWQRYVHDPDANGIGTVKYPRTVPKDEASAKQLKKRTLTNLYNQRPTWLDLAHKKLDEAVFAAYGWKPSMSDEEILEKLLVLNQGRAKGKP